MEIIKIDITASKFEELLNGLLGEFEIKTNLINQGGCNIVGIEFAVYKNQFEQKITYEVEILKHIIPDHHNKETSAIVKLKRMIGRLNC